MGNSSSFELEEDDVYLNNFQKQMLVYGYIRCYLNTFDIPNDIINLLLLWGFNCIIDEWDINAKSYGIEIIEGYDEYLNNNSIIVNNNTSKGYGIGNKWQTVCGSIKCISPHVWKYNKWQTVSGSINVYKWKLKILYANESYNNSINTMIGICREEDCGYITYTKPASKMYCFLGSKCDLYKHGIKVNKNKYGIKWEKKNDILGVYLDLNNMTLSYSINNINFGVAFKNIEPGIYRLALSLCPQRSVQLIQCVYPNHPIINNTLSSLYDNTSIL